MFFRTALALLLWAVGATDGQRREHVSLDLQFSADGARVPSRALLVELEVGVPETRRALMLDFNRSDLEIDGCAYSASFTFDVSGSPASDLIFFEEDSMIDPVAKGYYRFPVVEHCSEIGSMPVSYYAKCLAAECNGVIGMGAQSPLWDIWSAYSLSLQTLHLGRAHPKHSMQGANTVACRGPRLCTWRADSVQIDAHEFYAEALDVDVHVEDSYIYVPEKLYTAYMGKRNVYSSRLENGVGYEHWPPIVLRNTAADFELVIGPDMLVHSPALAATYGGKQTASGTFFSERSRQLLTPLLKTHADPGRISIGNALFKHYAVHRDLLEGTARFERRTTVEHFSLLQIVLMVGLLVVYLRRKSRHMQSMAAYGVGLGSAVKEGGSHLFRFVLHTLLVLLAALLLGNLQPSLSDIGPFFDWSVVVLVANALPLLVLSVYQWKREERRRMTGRRSQAAYLQWVTFRSDQVMSACNEHLLLLSLLWIALIRRGDDLGTVLAACLALALFYNAVRHLASIFYYSDASLVYGNRNHDAGTGRWVDSFFPSLTPEMRGVEHLSTPLEDALWVLFVVGVLLVINLIISSAMCIALIVYPYLLNVAAVALLYAIAAYVGVIVVQRYLYVAMVRAMRRLKSE